MPAFDPLPVQTLARDPQRRARQAREDVRPHPHAAGGAVQAGFLVLVVADPDHREVVAGVAGEPAVAAIVAGAGLAGRRQAAEAVADQRPAGAGRDRVLQRGADQARGHRIALLRGWRIAVVTLDRAPARIQHAAHRVQRLDLAIGGEELVQLRHRIRALVDRPEDQRGLALGLDAGQGADQLRQTLRLHVHAEAHRGLVVALRQRIQHVHGAVAAVVGIARLPVASAAQADRHRRIADRAGQRPFVRLGQRQQVDEGLEQRTDRALGIDRAVEALLGEIAAADHRDHVAVVHVGHHQAGLQRRPALAADRLQRARHRAFGIALRGRRHAGHHAEAGAGNRIGGVIARQLLAHQVDIGREAVGGDIAGVLGDSQRRLARALVFLVVDQAAFVHLAEHEIAALGGALRIAPRVVPGRPLDQADHQRDLLGGQVAQVAAEPELGGRGHAADRLRAALAQVDLVEIGLEDGALVVARFQQQRKQDFLELAGVGLFLADPEQAAARQLLGQRAGALAGIAAGFHVDEHGAQHAAEVHPDVVVEVAVLDRLQAGDQQFRHFLDPHQPPLFLLLAVQGGDARRVQARAAQRLAAAEVADRHDFASGQRHLQLRRGDPAIDIVVAAAGNPPAPAVARIGACTFAVAGVVGRGIQLGLQGLRIHRQAVAQGQRPCVDPGRHLPAQLAEAFADLVVQVQHVGDQEAQQQCRAGQAPGQQARSPAAAACVAALVVVLQVVVLVFDARHGRSGWRRFRGMRQCREGSRRV